MKINMYNRLVICVLLFAVACAIASCEDRGDTYKEFIPEGGTIYLGKAHSPMAFSGYQRMALSWWLSADPQVSNAKVFWNNGRDSLEIPVSSGGEPQKIEVLIDGLEEGVYLFEIYTYDDKDNRSLPLEVSGEVYGESYLSGLSNRSATSIELMDGKLYISWDALTGNSQSGIPIGVELQYMDKSGDTHKTDVAVADSETILANIKSGSKMEYRTMYIPDSLSIDTFYSASLVLDVPLYSLIDKTKFMKVVLPTDNTTQYNSTYPMELLWDGNPGTIYYTGKKSGVPTWFTFDVGQVVKLRRVRYNQRTSPASVLWSNNNPRYFEIWGTADTPEADGSWTGWTKLSDIESVKPSGLPAGENTEEDIAMAESGEEFDLSADNPAVRYIRIKVNETWSNSQNIHIAELTFWGE